MSAKVEVWMGELARLREKVLARKPFLLKRRTDGDQGEEEKKEASLTQQQGPSSSSSVFPKSAVETKKDNSMSEATICLLMDRFAPC
ncbi:hypothetical protein U1Q18_034933 [Sarracenia purpurea var. burkii]